MANWWENDPAAEEAGAEWWAADEPVAAPATAQPSDFQQRVARAREIAESPEVARQTGRNVDEIVRGAADVLTVGLADEAAARARATLGEDYETALAEERARDEAAPVGLRLMGQVPAAMTAGALVGAPRTLLQAMLQSGIFGSLYGYGSGEGGAAERSAEALKGGATGALIAAPVYGAANVLAPQASQALQRLYREGVRPTAGQMLGPTAARAEERLASIPIVGDVIRGARTRALEDFNRGAINHALKNAGLSLSAKTEAGRKAIAEADDLLGKSYDEILDGIPQIRIDQQFGTDLQRIAMEAKARLGNKGLKAFSNALQDMRSVPAMSKASPSGRELKRAVSGLRQDADRLAARPHEDIYQASLLVREAQNALSDLLKRNASPDRAAQLTGLDRAYAQFRRVRQASEAATKNEGVFTPFQLTQAVKQGEKATGRQGFARGEGLGQEFAEAGERVVGSKVPDSGTPERLMTALAVGGYFEPTAAMTGAALAAPYTRLGQNMLAALAGRTPSAGQQILAENLRRAALPLAAGSVVATE